MTLQTELEKIEAPGMAELYKFEVGSVINYYTSYVQNILYDGNLYVSAVIKRNTKPKEQSLKPMNLQISAPLDNSLIAYIADAPAENVKITISQLFFTTPQEIIVIFRGEIIDINIVEGYANCNCQSNQELFVGNLPRLVYSCQCNNILFDSNCLVSKASVKLTTNVTVSGSSLVSSDFALKLDDYYTGGYVEFGVNRRLITSHVGDTITIATPFDSRLTSGSSVGVFPGCLKDFDTCNTKFGNTGNFNGFPYIPSINPVIYGVE